MNSKFSIILSAVVIVVVAVGAFIVNYNLSSTMRTMEFIESRIQPNGEFLDYDNSIGVKDASDLGWWQKDGNWYVMYGKLELQFTPKQLQDKKYLELIGRIGLDIRGNLEEQDLKFYWRDIELDEWVPN